MPTVYNLFSNAKQSFFDNGSPAVGYQMFIYAAGTTTKSTSYTTSAGTVANANPIILDSRGETPSGVYVEDGSYKIVFATDTDTDPPATPVWTEDNVRPAGLPTVSVSEWVDSGWTVSFISSTELSLSTSHGDQTGVLHVGRRIRIVDSGGTDYATIESSDFNSTVANATYVEIRDTTIDSGLSDVDYSFIPADNSNLPHLLSDSDGLTLSSGSAFTLSKAPEVALDAVSLQMLGANFINGFTLSNNSGDSDHDIDIAAGAAADSGNTHGLILTGAGLTKELDATWASGTGAGGLFTGSIAANTWYHVFVIRNTTTDAIDAGFDTSLTAANIPSGYTQYRRLGSVVTDASSNILGFYQTGDMFYWNSPTLDHDAAISATATDYALTNASAGVPPGVNVEMWANMHCTANLIYVTSAVSGFSSSGPSVTAAPLVTIDGSAESALVGPIVIDNVQQINAEANTGTPTLRVSVVAYRDPRISTGIA